MRGNDPENDPYALLGVPRDASSSEITRAYRRLVRTHHPDTAPASGPAEPARPVAVYALLCDPARRTAHSADGAAADGDAELPLRGDRGLHRGRRGGRDDRAAATRPTAGSDRQGPSTSGDRPVCRHVHRRSRPPRTATSARRVGRPAPAGARRSQPPGRPRAGSIRTGAAVAEPPRCRQRRLRVQRRIDVATPRHPVTTSGQRRSPA